MRIDSFSNTAWCDLGIVILKIYSKSKWESRKLLLLDKNPDESNELPVVNVYVCDKDDSVFEEVNSYREKIMLKGLYLGHHFGESARLRVIDDYNIAISHSEPDEVIRWYVTKYVLNIFSLKENIMYLKGGAVEYKGKAFLILGRGGSGKTELIKELCKNSVKFISNTHLLVKTEEEAKVKGINSNVRVRKNGKDEFIPVYDLYGDNVCFDYTSIGGIFWFKYKIDGESNIRELKPDEIFYNMQFFSEATINWEMKEDIADYCESDPNIFKNNIAAIYDRLKMLSNLKSYYLNLDIHTSDGLNKTLSLMETMAAG